MRGFKKYFKSSVNNFSPIGMCDQTNFMVPHNRMVWQLEYNSQGLYNTGLLVYDKFADKPNPTNLAPKFFGDPKPILNASPSYYIKQGN